MMANKKLLVVTAGDALSNFAAALPQLVYFFATSRGQTIKLIDADPGPGWLYSIDESCDRVRPGAPADRGRAIVKAYAATDLLLFDVGRSLSNIDDVMAFLNSAREEAEIQGRAAVAFLPIAFVGSPAVLRIPPGSECLVAGAFKVRFALESAVRKAYHVECANSYVRMGSILPLGKGLVDLIRRDGPTLAQFLDNTPGGYGFAANHIRAWINKCIDGGVFDDIISNDQLVPGWFQPWSHYWARRALDYRFSQLEALDDVHDDALFKRYGPFWEDRRDVLTSIGPRDSQPTLISVST